MLKKLDKYHGQGVTDEPDFRYKALEDKFIGHMRRLCELFRDFGELKDEFDI